MKLRSSFVVLAVVTFAVSASAEKLELKPGLWEINQQMASASGRKTSASGKEASASGKETSASGEIKDASASGKETSASPEMEATAEKMRQKLAKMTPEQRKDLEDMLSKQGAKMGAGGQLELSRKVCMTREMVERNEIPMQQGNCKTTTQSRKGNAVKTTFACTDPPSSGEGQYTIVSPEAYTTKMLIRTTAPGKTGTVSLDASGKWLAADCGSVKPAHRPTAK